MNGSPHRRHGLWIAGQMFCRFVITVFFDLKVRGIHHVPKRGGVLLVANHQSFLDPVLVAVRLRRPVSFMARASLFRNPLFGWLIHSLHAFPIEQGKGDRAAMQESIARLQAGHILNIYPEGSRTEDGEIGPIQAGVALLVRRAGVPIVPVVIDGSFQAWPRGRTLPRPGAVRVAYGPPLRVDHLRSDDIVRLIDATLRRMLSELRGQA